MNNLLLIAVLIIALWVIIFAFYFVLVRNQKSLEKEINKVESLLGEDEAEETTA